ncbi:MAG: hypothetical protein HYZ13_04065 [Acidobacteria bacterium]|nr:hypothetical protein [Acidobacteriota bacterium]
MSSFDWKGALGKVAPWLATTLGGPGAGLAVEALCRATGLEPSPENARKAAEMAAAGSLTGEQFLALQKAEAEHMERMQAMGYKQLADLEEIAFRDRDSARNREIQVRDHTNQILAYAITAGFFGTLGYILNFGLPQQNEAAKNVLLMLVGSLGTAWTTGVVGYYFGSSSGSDRKTDLIGRLRDDASGEGR